MKILNAFDYYQQYWKYGIDKWTPRDLNVEENEIKLISDYIKPNNSVLEIGCGDGRLAEIVKKIGADYTGIDISEQAVNICKAKGISAIVHDVNMPLPFESKTFDVVMIFEVLEHLFLPELCLKEVKRVLHPGGIIIGSVPNIVYLPNRILMVMGYFNPGGSPATSLKAPYRDPHIRFFTKKSLIKLFREIGFVEIHIIGKKFSLIDLPVLYRTPLTLRKFLNLISAPFSFLGKFYPSLFSLRIYFIAKKPYEG
jgi:methionine biosynthesis protein MetW